VADLLFYLTALAALLSSVGVVVAKSPVMSVISLLASFFCVSVIYLLAGFQFLAAVQILVYAGAVMVLFLFVVMLLNLGDPIAAEALEAAAPGKPTPARAPLGLAIAGAVLALVLFAVLTGVVPPAAATPPAEGYDPVGSVAALLFGRYALPFEAASVLLLVTAVGVLVLAKRERGADRLGEHFKLGLGEDER